VGVYKGHRGSHVAHFDILVTMWSSLSTDEEPPIDMKLDGFRVFHHVDTMREINRQM
jgi:hypothetical protein